MNFTLMALILFCILIIAIYTCIGVEYNVFKEEHAKYNSISSIILGVVLTLFLIYVININKPKAIDVARGRAYTKYNVEMIDDTVKTWKITDTTFVFKKGYHRQGL